MNVLNEAQVREISRFPLQVIRKAIAKMPLGHPLEGYYEELTNICESLYRSRLGTTQLSHEDQDDLRKKLADHWCSNPPNEFAFILCQIWSHINTSKEQYRLELGPIPLHLLKKYGRHSS